VYPALCPVGYYSIGKNTTCGACAPGYVCPPGSSSPTPPGSECQMGGYCPDGVSFVPCPGGSRGYRSGATSFYNGCEPCPGGFYCTQGSTRASTLMCEPGYYCPINSTSPTACPAGTYNLLPQQSGPTSNASCVTCPAGGYCPLASVQPQLCPPGYYCLTGSATYTGTPCGAGTYGGASRRGLQAQTDCYNCTTGAYCPGNGTPDPVPCSTGKYNPSQGGSSSSACLSCPAGYACTTTGTAVLSTRCAQGYYW